MTPDGLAIRRVPGKGRGVFATRAFARGELLATCLTLELPPADCRRLDGTALHNHYFTSANVEGGLLALGLLTLVNHATPPNADWDYRHDPDAGWLVELRAAREIAAGEELTIDYNTELWFEAAG